MDCDPTGLVSLKEELWNRTCTKGGGDVETQKEDGPLQAKEEASGECNPADTLILDFWPPEL